MRSEARAGLIPDWLDAWFTRSVTPVIRRLIVARVNPNAITVAAFALTLCGGVLIAFGHLIAACALIVAGGILDFSDGKVAALTNRVTVFGGILDSFLDRYADAAVYIGLTIFFARGKHDATALAAVFALVGSTATSYVMAVGKAHGYVFRTGVLRRQDRVTLIAAGLLLSVGHTLLAGWLTSIAGALGLGLTRVATLPLAPIVWLLAVLTNLTAMQRLVAVRRLARGEPVRGDAGEALRDRQLRALHESIDCSPAEGGRHG
jgi:CDP-diacylglycerol--glycerol-3-phosphate 3-phosphatidyltransferase